MANEGYNYIVTPEVRVDAVQDGNTMVAVLPSAIYDRYITGWAIKGASGADWTLYRDMANGTRLTSTPRGDNNSGSARIHVTANTVLVGVWNKVGPASVTFFQEQADKSLGKQNSFAVNWSETRPDVITVPASAPIGAAQDAVIISGANMPPELTAAGITAAIIFQRGAYPSEGSSPEAKYYYMGISGAPGKIDIGAGVDTKTGGIIVVPQLSFGQKFYYTASDQGYRSTGVNTMPANDVGIGTGRSRAGQMFDLPLPSPAPGGLTLTGAGKYWQIPLNAGWSLTTDTRYANGVQWSASMAGTGYIRGGVVVNNTAPYTNPIAHIDHSAIFPALQMGIDQWHGPIFCWCSNGGAITNNTCLLALTSAGDLVVSDGMPAPANGATLFFSFSYPINPITV